MQGIPDGTCRCRCTTVLSAFLPIYSLANLLLQYFSTLERLRFAQNPNSFTIKDGAALSRRQSVDHMRIKPTLSNDSRQSPKSTPPRSRRPRTSRQFSISSGDVSWFLTLPDKIRKKQLSREEEALETGGRRDTVILDAADEAIYKASRRASRNLTPLTSTTLPSVDSSMNLTCVDGGPQPNSVTKAMYESFRWMDEENDLDLRLTLDDYHANLNGVVNPAPGNTQRPSYRRHMSISKIPFSRNSISSSTSQNGPTKVAQQSHGRQKSRAMSFIQPRHTVSESISSIDPNATHYQDPEARLKLRVYLASPQKFDEAIEFGFPSLEGVSSTADKENQRLKKVAHENCGHVTPIINETRSFLDDNISLSSDTSMLEPDSPLTPSEPDGAFKTQAALRPPFSKGNQYPEDFLHLGSRKPFLHKHAESYSQSITGSREMTLRMTLTRPDLRADESLLYSWQGAQRTKRPLAEVSPTKQTAGSEKVEVKGPFGGIDGWGPGDKENGVVRRLWNRVRSGPRKTPFY